MFGYPVSLQLDGHRAVVIGAEAVAQGKPEGLLAAGALVTVIATGPEPALARLERHAHVTLTRRGWLPADLDGATVCVAASSDPAERAAIYRVGRERGVLMNVMDDIPHCDFAAPAVVRRGELTIAIATGGRSPALARRLCMELQERFGPEWATILQVLAEAREKTLPALPDLHERAARWRAALDLEEAEHLVRAGRAADLKARLIRRLTGGEVPAERAS
jgi:siroheme synthase-like protein